MATKIKDFAEDVFLDKRQAFINQTLNVYLVESDVDQSTIDFVNFMNPELTLLIPDNEEEVTHYFQHVRLSLQAQEIARFSGKNKLCGEFKQVPSIRYTTQNEFKSSSGYFSYILPIDITRGKTLKQFFSPLNDQPLRVHNFLITANSQVDSENTGDAIVDIGAI